MIRSALITGANSGLGKECARQLADLDEVERIVLACRNPDKAEAAKADLEQATGRSIFEVLIVDVSDLDSVRRAAAELTGTVDAVVLNAGGMGGRDPGKKTKSGVTQLFAVNVLGHALLVDELLAAEKIGQVVMYAGSEAARGVPKMGMKRPALESSSADDFATVADGTAWNGSFDPMQAYGAVKYLAAMWMSSMARKHPTLRFVTMSPGGTSGTEVFNDLPPVRRFMFKAIGVRLMPLFGLMHGLEKGAKRYVDALVDHTYETGVFYASEEPVLTGPVVDQAEIFPDLSNPAFQDNANEAVHRFL